MAQIILILSKIKNRHAQIPPANDFRKVFDYLGLKIVHEEDNSLMLLQQKYAERLVDEMELLKSSASPVSCDVSEEFSTTSIKAAIEDFPYGHLIGSLLYLATRTRSDIAVAISMLARHVKKSPAKHAMNVLKLIKYLSGMTAYGLTLRPCVKNQLPAHVDPNWGGEPVAGKRLMTEVVIMYKDTLEYDPDSLEKCVTLSRTEAEYVKLSDSAKIVVR